MIKAVPLIEFVPVHLYDEPPEHSRISNNNDVVLREQSIQQASLQSTPLIYPESKRIQDEETQDFFIYRNLGVEDAPSLSVGVPIPKKELILVGGRLVYPRDRNVAQCALMTAQHKCEIDYTHPTFIGKSRNLPYTEPHHLIPLAFSDYFGVSLDVVENIVSLCSNCHNQIHYGKDIELMLKRLFDARKAQLEQVGINISFEKLLWMYKVVATTI